jgi:hypothetical protein
MTQNSSAWESAEARAVAKAVENTIKKIHQ